MSFISKVEGASPEGAVIVGAPTLSVTTGNFIDGAGVDEPFCESGIFFEGLSEDLGVALGWMVGVAVADGFESTGTELCVEPMLEG